MRSIALVPGSVGAVAQRDGLSLAEALLGAEIIILIDSSGSMAAGDSRGGRSRWDVAVEELTRLQTSHPGRIAVVSFSDAAAFAPSGVPKFLGGGTDLAAGLRFVHQFDGTVRFIVISDGVPDSESDALSVARTFTSRIDTVYVGPEGDRRGARFLEKLASVAGGRHVTADRAQELAERVETLLLTPCR